MSRILAQVAEVVRRRAGAAPVRILRIESGTGNRDVDALSIEGASTIRLDLLGSIDGSNQTSYDWPDLDDESFDLALCDESFASVEFPWSLMEAIAAKVKPYGLACVAIPEEDSADAEASVIRFSKTGWRRLGKWAGLIAVDSAPAPIEEDVTGEQDRWAVFVKDASPGPSTNRSAPRRHEIPVGGRPTHATNPRRLPKRDAASKPACVDIGSAVRKIEGKVEAILEVGCGAGTTGSLVRSILQPTRYVGIDRDEAAVAMARARLDEVHRVDLECVSFESLGVGDDDFDLVIVSDVLEHLIDPWDFVADLVRLVRPGGHLLVSVSNVQNLSVVVDLVEGRWPYAGQGLHNVDHVRFFTLGEIRRLINEVGLRVVDVSGILDPPLKGKEIKECDNIVSFENLTLSGQTRDQMLAFFVYRYIVLARKPE